MKLLLSKYDDLTQRVITALVGAVVIIFCVIWNQWSYFALFLFICIFTQLEFYKLLKLDDMVPLKTWGTLAGISVYLVWFMEQAMDIPSKFYFLLLPVTFIAFLIKLYKKAESKPFTNLGLTFLGIIYVALPFSLFHIPAFYTGEYRYEIVLGIILIQWASDTGAFFAGIRFGKRKLFERVSPKKSWEGFLGGLMVAIAMSWACNKYLGILLPAQWIGVGLIVAVVGTYGDLIESLFKRSMEIKDSGTSIPGHGGFLDRFDSLLLSLPFIATFLKLF
jgi:phosphatidate cytidylyltransferase